MAPTLEVPGARLRRREVRRDLARAVPGGDDRGRHVSIHFQFAPYRLRQGDWGRRASLERWQSTPSPPGSGIPGSVREVQSITPRDLEQDWGLTEGDLNHGQLILDQILFMRPMPGWSDHRTPVDGLFLGGSGVHGGGGLSGASGRNAARAVLRSR